MIYLTPSPSLKKWTYNKNLGLMVQPNTGTNLKILDTGAKFGIDNGCFTQGENFDLAKYLDWLKRLIKFQKNCLFATAPDVVGDSRETWKRSEDVLPQIRELGFPPALVAQDGMENYPVRWGSFDCFFIGGTTEWKLSDAAYQLAKEAKSNGCSIHMGRVNSRQRLRIAYLSGCDSADGTHLVFKPDARLFQLEKWMGEIRRQPFLQGLNF